MPERGRIFVPVGKGDKLFFPHRDEERFLARLGWRLSEGYAPTGLPHISDVFDQSGELVGSIMNGVRVRPGDDIPPDARGSLQQRR